VARCWSARSASPYTSCSHRYQGSRGRCGSSPAPRIPTSSESSVRTLALVPYGEGGSILTDSSSVSHEPLILAGENRAQEDVITTSGAERDEADD
jgi:hypothetical protein